MNYPASIHIKGYEYKVEFVRTTQEVDWELKATDCLAQVNSRADDRSFRILASQSPFGVLDCLIHEILHAIIFRNRALKSLLNENAEETFVDTIACELANLLISNNFELPSIPEITERIK